MSSPSPLLCRKPYAPPRRKDTTSHSARYTSTNATTTHNSTRPGLPCPTTLSKFSGVKSMTLDALTAVKSAASASANLMFAVKWTEGTRCRARLWTRRAAEADVEMICGVDARSPGRRAWPVSSRRGLRGCPRQASPVYTYCKEESVNPFYVGIHGYYKI